MLGALGDGVDNILGSLGQQLSNMVNTLGRAGTEVLSRDITGQPSAQQTGVARISQSIGGMAIGPLLLLGVGAWFLLGSGRRRR